MNYRRNSVSSAYSEASTTHLAHEPTAYVPVRVLGKGAFGEAVLYRKSDDQMLVVWKEIFLGKLDENGRRDAQKEVEVLSLLDHPNVIAYYNHFLDGDSLLIEMEYANAGSLYHRLGVLSNLMDEREVVWYLYQITSALCHIHELCILHRDIKTLNIFLTKTCLVKVGDFGIAKILSDGDMAETCVGTAYYLSPEIIKGQPYSYHSDMWALGCVLYEMLTLKRTFDATNPLRLAAEIVSGHFDDISAEYSQDMREVLHSLLSQEPEERPTAENLLKHSLLGHQQANFSQRIAEISEMEGFRRPSSGEISQRTPVVMRKRTEVYQWGAGRRQPQRVECFEHERAASQVIAGINHMAVITIEKELYTWSVRQGAANISGELGHGDKATYRSPKLVTSLVGLPLKQVCCGEDFTVCSSDDGRLFTFGSNYYHCLGVGSEASDALLPVEVSFFHRSRRVHRVAAGDAHVIVLTQDFEVFTWGSGEFGRLGLGDEDDYATPQQVDLSTLLSSTKCQAYRPRDVIAGSDGSFILTEFGKVFACGNNEHNKLGFNNAASGVGRNQHPLCFDIPCELRFCLVKPLSRFHVRTLSPGRWHCAVIDECDELLLFGSNRQGQLGTGDYKPYVGPQKVSRTLAGKKFLWVACGDDFTVASTRDNQVYSWGRGTDGQLGYDVLNKTPGEPQCQATPKPTFGVLHDVVALSARSWHVLMIAERLLNKRVVQTSSHRSSANASPLMFGSFGEMTPASDSEVISVSEQGPDGGGGGAAFFGLNPVASPPAGHLTKSTVQAGKSMSDSFVPDWLKDEMDNAEFIPMENTPVVQQQLSLTSLTTSESSDQHPLPCNGECIYTIRCLETRIQELEAENATLRLDLRTLVRKNTES